MSKCFVGIYFLRDDFSPRGCNCFSYGVDPFSGGVGDSGKQSRSHKGCTSFGKCWINLQGPVFKNIVSYSDFIGQNISIYAIFMFKDLTMR